MKASLHGLGFRAKFLLKQGVVKSNFRNLQISSIRKYVVVVYKSAPKGCTVQVHHEPNGFFEGHLSYPSTNNETHTL